MPKTKEKTDVKKVVITIDMGASKTKAIVQEYPEGKPVVLLFDSEVSNSHFEKKSEKILLFK